MVSRRARRRGHSLAELLVALVILGAMMAGISATTILATRWTTTAVLQQRAVADALAVLDSLTALPDPPSPGTRQGDESVWTVEWEAGPAAESESAGATIVVMVRAADTGRTLASLTGLWFHPPPLSAP